MARRAIAVDVLVEHETLGDGVVERVDDSGGVVVRFKNGDPRPMSASVAANLKVLSEDGLKARLRRDPEQTGLWAKEAPLKLVASALVDIGEAAKAAPLQAKLEEIVVDNTDKKWKGWWDLVRPAFDHCEFFSVKKNTKGAFESVSLARGMSANDVPALPLPEKPKAAKAPKKKPATKKEWEGWLSGKADGPPSNQPNKGVFKLLTEWKAKATIGASVARTLEGASAWMSSGSKSEKVAANWLEAVARASMRWRELAEADSDAGSAKQTGETLVRLAQVTGNTNETMGWLCRAGELDKRPDGWRMEFHTGMWAAFRESADAGENFLRALGISLGRHCQTGLVEDIMLAAFRTDQSPQRNFYLDNMLYGIPGRERIPVLHSLVVRSSAGETHKREVADYIRNSRHLPKADGDGRLDALVVASLLLSDGTDAIVEQASIALADALESPRHDVTPLDGLLRDSRKRNRTKEKNWAAKLEHQRLDYESKVGAGQKEQERLTELVKGYASRAASAREESKLEARLDILQVIGEILDMGYSSGNVEDRLQSVLVSLPLALRAGDSEPIGVVGDIVPYDPRLHRLESVIASGAQVQICTPGVVFRGRDGTDRVIQKAKAHTKTETSE